MDNARWERIQSLFHAAADLPVSSQRAFLEHQCNGDLSLVSDVEKLLQQDAKGLTLLDSKIADVAHQVLGKGSRAYPEKIGPYCIKSVLGEGGMGVVYLAEREDLHTLVAIKVLLDAPLSPGRRVRFAQEQRTLAQLDHPYIARLYDADTLPDGTPFFVMEYVEGNPLTKYCLEQRLAVEERLQLFRAVCEAVQCAHNHAVIHRDLKPSNILVKTDGTVRLLDFGIAKQMESFDLGSDRTLTALRLMTPAYAAPEQFRGGSIGVHTDVYSLGVILYELLSGRAPFDLSNRTPLQAEQMIVEHEPARPSSLVRQGNRSQEGKHLTSVLVTSWPDLDVLCLTAMHKAPERRYRSVEALIRDIDHYLKGEPLEARPDSFPYRFQKFVRRNRRVVWTGSLVAMLVLTMAVVFTVRLTIARNEALAEAERTQRIQRFMLNVFEGGDREAGPSEDLRVVTLLDRGMQEAQSLSNEPEVQAELYLTLGNLYQKFGQFDRAETLLNAALQQRRSIFGERNSKVAESLVALGLLRVDQAKLEEAERLVREGLQMSRDTLRADHPAVGYATDALGRVLEERGQYDRSIQVLEEAVRLRTNSDAQSLDLATSLYELANTHFYAGHYTESQSLNERALVIYAVVHGERHPLVADVLVNLGAIQYERGNYQKAEEFYRKALEINEPWFGHEHHKTAATLTMLGRVLVRQKRYDEAASQLQSALAIQQRVFGEVHPRVASTVNELATINLMRKNLDSAENGFRLMESIYRSVYGDQHYLVAVALSNSASVEVERKEYAKAEKIYRDVIARFTRALAPDHLNTAIARIKLGRTLVRQHRFAEAEPEIVAGYEILSKQTNPAVSYLRAAREDLVSVYDALRRPEQAKRFRTELLAE